jgi:hypothetical protein
MAAQAAEQRPDAGLLVPPAADHLGSRCPQTVAEPSGGRRPHPVLAAARLLVQGVRAPEADRHLRMIAEADDVRRQPSLPTAPAGDLLA